MAILLVSSELPEIIGIIFYFLSPFFLMDDNFINIFRQATVMMLYAIGGNTQVSKLAGIKVSIKSVYL